MKTIATFFSGARLRPWLPWLRRQGGGRLVRWALPLVPVAAVGQTFVYLSGYPLGCTKPAVPTLDVTQSVCALPGVVPLGSFEPPGPGETYIDPTFGGTVRVVTSVAAASHTQTYSTPSALSATGKYVATGDAGATRVFRVVDGRDMGTFGPSQDWGFWWHSTDDEKFFTLEQDRFYARDLAGGKALLLDGPAKGLTGLRTGGTGDVSRDHWVAFWARTQNQICLAPLDGSSKVWCVPDAWSKQQDFLLLSKGVDRRTARRYLAVENAGVVLQFDGQSLGLAYVPPEHPDALAWRRGDGDGVLEEGEWAKNAQWDHADTVEIAGEQYVYSNYEREGPAPEVFLALYRMSDPTTTPIFVLGTVNRAFQPGTDATMKVVPDPLRPVLGNGTHYSCARNVPACSAGFGLQPTPRSLADHNLRQAKVWAGEIQCIEFAPDLTATVRRLAVHRSVEFSCGKDDRNDPRYGVECWGKDYGSMPKASISPSGEYISAISNFGFWPTAYPGPGDTRRTVVVSTGLAQQPPPAFLCKVTSGSLPPGLSITGCEIAGTPSQAGTFAFTIAIASEGATPASRAYSITIGPARPAPKVVIDTDALPGGEVGRPYSQSIAARVVPQ